MKVLVTGAAGFIGHHVCARLAGTQHGEVLGVDNLNDYYPVELKRARLAELASLDNFRFVQMDFADAKAFGGLYEHYKPDYVVHLGAQANVRYSVENPGAYVQSNLVGFHNVLEAARARPPRHLVFASSSSVYGMTATLPFSEEGDTSHPLSFYGATKKANEVMAHSYAHLYGLNITGLRFFNVYGPWGRPDTAPTLFARAIFMGEPINLFAEGKARRDFTYIDDIVDGLLKILLYPLALNPSGKPNASPRLNYRIFNLGHNHPVELLHFVRMLEQLIGREAKLNLMPAQLADVPETCADLTRIHAAYGYSPRVPLAEGLRRFVTWFRTYYGQG